MLSFPTPFYLDHRCAVVTNTKMLSKVGQKAWKSLAQTATDQLNHHESSPELNILLHEKNSPLPLKPLLARFSVICSWIYSSLTQAFTFRTENYNQSRSGPRSLMERGTATTKNYPHLWVHQDIEYQAVSWSSMFLDGNGFYLESSLFILSKAL